MSGSSLSREIASPDFYLYEVDIRPSPWGSTGTAAFVRIAPEIYHRAAFLRGDEVLVDDFIYLTDLERFVDAAEALGTAPRSPALLLNTGFCGSTLLARALGELPDLFVLREPRALDCLNLLRERVSVDTEDGRASWQRLLSAGLRCLARTYDPSAVPVLKVNELTLELTCEIMAHDAGTRAIFLYSSLSEFLPAVLKSSARIQETRRKVKRMRDDVAFLRELAEQVDQAPDVQAIALAWLIEQYNHVAVTERFGLDRMRSIDAATFLATPAASLEALSRHIGVGCSAEIAARVAASEIMTTHAKRSESYPQDRRLADSERLAARFADQIREGLDWAAAIEVKFPIRRPLATAAL